MSKPKSEYSWKLAYVEVGVRLWRMTDRATGRILGYCPETVVGGAHAWDAVVLPVVGPEINCGSYDHWAKAKRAVQSAVTGMRLADALGKVPTVDVKLNATSFCRCPIENHNDIPEGPFCLVCGKPVR